MKKWVLPILLHLALVIPCFAADPSVIVLAARDAKIGGDHQAVYEGGTERDNIGIWRTTNATAVWKFDLPERGAYRVIVVYSCDDNGAGNTFEITVGGQHANGVTASTHGWTKYVELDLGPVILRKPGPMELTARPTRILRTFAMNIQAVRLVREP